MEEEKVDKPEKKDKIKSLLKDIHSNDDKKIIKAISALKRNGDDSVITPLIDLWNVGVTKKVEQAIISFLGDITSTTSADYIMDAVLDNNYSPIRQSLLTVIWNSKIDYSDYLVDFVTLAIQNDFMVALECLTIIENLKGPLEEHHLLDAEIIIREYAEKNQKDINQEDQRKLALVQEISQIITSPEID